MITQFKGIKLTVDTNQVPQDCRSSLYYNICIIPEAMLDVQHILDASRFILGLALFFISAHDFSPKHAPTWTEAGKDDTVILDYAILNMFFSPFS